MKKRILSILLTACMVVTLLPNVALAAETTGTFGAFSVTYDDSDTAPAYDGSSKTLTLGNGTYTVAMAGSTTQTTTDKIVVSSSATASITLSNVNIDVSGADGCAFDMTGATVNLTLSGTNALKSGGGFAGLQVPEGASLTITAASTGTMDATCVKNSSDAKVGAGIGGGSETDGGSVTINGGTVIATGNGNRNSGACGAGIGGGGSYNGTGGSGGVVNITGGTVTAKGFNNSAGIGGGGSANGTGGSGGVVNITGGTVIATGGGWRGAGIGGGGGVGSGAGAAESTAGTDNGTLKNASGVDVQLYTLTLSGGSSAKAVTGLTLPDSYSYGITDMKTGTDGKLYLYLPAGKTGAVTATAAAGDYTGSIAGNAATLSGPPLITINDVSIAEGNAGNTDLTFTVSLDKVGASTITVNYATANNTAAAGTDYTSTSGTLTFAAGETTKAAIITVNGDNNYEENETFYVNLTSASASDIGDDQGVGTITNDDLQPAVALSLTGSPLAENGGAAAVTATLSNLSYQNVAVTLGYTGTASAADYTTSGAIITISAGSLTGAAIITGADDSTDEDEETVIVDITGVANGSESGTQQVTATITDDDAPPSISINDPSVAEGNAGTATLQFTASLSAPSGKIVTVDYATTAGGIATAGTDYISATGTLTFAPGETTKTISVTVNGDVTEEANETVVMNLSNVSNATIGDSQGTGTIMNDDSDLTPPAAVTNISLSDSDTTSGVDGRDFTVGFDDSADDATDVLSYKIFVYKDGEEPANKVAMDALTAGNKIAVKTISRTAGDDGADANLGSGTATDSKGQALAGGDYWIIVTAVDGSGNYCFAKTAAKVTVTSDATSGGSSGSNNHYTPTGTTTTVIVNGQSHDAGTATTSKEGDKTVTTVTVDDKKIQEKLNAEGMKATVSIPISGNSDIGEGVLNGQTVKNMEEKEAVLEIKTGSVSYSLPASEINISEVPAQIGEAVQLKDIKISVKIAEPPADTVRVVQDTANQNNYQIVVKPVEFEITCTNGEKKVNVSKFNGYVERTIAVPDGVDPSKITTGIVLNEDGTFSHVPTTIVRIDGKYYAKINSLTNSTYSLIYNPVEFADVAKHWAKDSVNEMGSRLIVSGSGNGNYSPDKEITRAEFAAIVIRALGLKAETTEGSFADIEDTAWYAGYVDTAVSYGIITGYSDGKFGPNDKITREQAMTMIARAMKLTGLYTPLTDAEMSVQISSYADGATSSEYAKDGIAACLKTGVISGKSSSELAPKAYITRAEVAVIIERMLEKSGLI